MKERYSEMIEELTGRKVLAFLSQAHIERDLTIEMFLTARFWGSARWSLLSLQPPSTAARTHSASVVFSAHFMPCVSFGYRGSHARQPRASEDPMNPRSQVSTGGLQRLDV
jgi:hypothetical protein